MYCSWWGSLLWKLSQKSNDVQKQEKFWTYVNTMYCIRNLTFLSHYIPAHLLLLLCIAYNEICSGFLWISFSDCGKLLWASLPVLRRMPLFFFPYTDNEDPVLLICSFTKSRARQLFSGLRLLIYLRQIEKWCLAIYISDLSNFKNRSLFEIKHLACKKPSGGVAAYIIPWDQWGHFNCWLCVPGSSQMQAEYLQMSD